MLGGAKLWGETNGPLRGPRRTPGGRQKGPGVLTRTKNGQRDSQMVRETTMCGQGNVKKLPRLEVGRPPDRQFDGSSGEKDVCFALEEELKRKKGARQGSTQGPGNGRKVVKLWMSWKVLLGVSPSMLCRVFRYSVYSGPVLRTALPDDGRLQAPHISSGGATGRLDRPWRGKYSALAEGSYRQAVCPLQLRAPMI